MQYCPDRHCFAVQVTNLRQSEPDQTWNSGSTPCPQTRNSAGVRSAEGNIFQVFGCFSCPNRSPILHLSCCPFHLLSSRQRASDLVHASAMAMGGSDHKPPSPPHRCHASSSRIRHIALQRPQRRGLRFSTDVLVQANAAWPGLATERARR